MNPQLLALLGDYRELYEERAAIREFDGGQLRKDAELAAYKEVVEIMRKERANARDSSRSIQRHDRKPGDD